MQDAVIVGGGIVGLATARALLSARPGAKVTVLEKADDVGTAQTGHNSGVIHAGLYYAPGSLKSRLCRAGLASTKRFCDEHGIAYRTVGKLVVATDAVELERMRRLEERATTNGVALERVPGPALRELEPNVEGVEGLLSPATAIVDFRQVTRAIAQDVVDLGGRVVVRSQVRSISERHADRSVHVESDTGSLTARALVACAGLQADRVARMGGMDVDFRIVPFRGEYYQLPSSRRDVVGRLIYPVPDPALPFLGVHLTPMVDGRVTVGPNAVLGFAREGYPKGSIRVADVASYLTYPGLWRFAPGYVGTGFTEMRNSLSKRGYLELVRKYCPSLTTADLLPYPAGIRAQAIDRRGNSVEDFLLRRSERQLHVCNAPSPAATSALPIGEHIAAQLATLLAD